MVSVEGAAGEVAGPLGLDVDNKSGAVTVIVDPKLAAPTVAAVAVNQRPQEEHWAAASLATDSGRAVLRVVASPPAEGGVVNLEIRTPSCGGIRVRSADGRVTLRGISGSIDVQTSLASADGVAIDVATTAVLTDAVRLSADRGDIQLLAGEGTSGQITSTTPRGMTSIKVGGGALSGAKSVPGSWTGVLNGGSNAVTLSAEHGSVRIEVR